MKVLINNQSTDNTFLMLH